MIHISTVVEMTQEAETQHHCTALRWRAGMGRVDACASASMLPFPFRCHYFCFCFSVHCPLNPSAAQFFYFLHHSPMQIHGLTHKVVQLPCCRCSHLLLPPYRIVAAAGSAKGSTTLLTPYRIIIATKGSASGALQRHHAVCEPAAKGQGQPVCLLGKPAGRQQAK